MHTAGRLPFPPVWAYWKRRVAVGGAVVVGLAAIAVGVYFLVPGVRDKDEAAPPPAPAPAPKVIVKTKNPQPKAAQDVGFPEFATKNTTRVGGAESVADAAGVALAVFPSTGGVPGPNAVTLVDSNDWPSGIAAASLAAPPVSAPILLSAGDTVPSLTADALRAMAPPGSAATQGKQLFAIGETATPSGLDTETVKGKSPASIAAEIDSLRQKLTGSKPKNVLLTTSSAPEYAMPAASWAARSGDPVLFVNKDSVPKPTMEALKRDGDVPAFVLGPTSAISDKALKQIQEVSPDVKRIGDEDPVQSAIDFAREASGSFGWDINDPGHGLVIASATRPLDAAAAAPLSASGDWGPLLVTDDAQDVPAALRGYLLDIKPGYVSDPTRALYNHVWIIGDETTISVGFQAQIDDLAEVAPVSSGGGESIKPPPTSSPQKAKPKKP